jgi:hypothetical protein
MRQIYKSNKGYYYKKTHTHTKRISVSMYNQLRNKKNDNLQKKPTTLTKITSRKKHLEKYTKHKNKLNNHFSNNVLMIYYLHINKKYKIAIFKTIFEIKEKYHSKGYGTKIINELLEHVDYLLVKNIMNENANMFWQKFNHVSANKGFGKKILNLIKTKQEVIKPKYLLYKKST